MTDDSIARVRQYLAARADEKGAGFISGVMGMNGSGNLTIPDLRAVMKRLDAARAENEHLRTALRAIADGEGHADEIARQTLREFSNDR